jgi:hypothetical protein
LEALKTLWDRHWPLSLLYGLYCIADIRVAPPMTTPYLKRVQHTNYCDLPFRDAAFGMDQYSTLPFVQSGAVPDAKQKL